MPTVFILFGFVSKFYSNDHEPLHIHVLKDGHKAKFSIFPVELVENIGTAFSIKATNMEIEKIWLTKEAVWIRTGDGHEACERFEDYPRLKSASAKQRANYEADEYGIHWPELDEDLSFEGFFHEKSRTELYRFFETHPELNASAIARRMGISQSLFAQYISGIKTPSSQRLDQIHSTLQRIGKELLEDPLLL